MPRKKILVITHNFPRFPEDSSGQFLFTLYREFQREHDVFILCPHGPGLKRHEQLENMRIVRFRYWFASGENLAYGGDMQDRVSGSITGKIAFISLIIAGAVKAFCMIKREKIDIMHCHWWIPCGIIGFIAALVAGKPYIQTSHGTDIILLYKKKFLRILAGVVYKRASHVTTVSTFLADKLKSLYNFPISKVVVFPMPYDADKFVHDDSIEYEPGYILAIGRFNEQKGFEHLIRACGLLKQQGIGFKMDLIGSGPLEGYFGKLIDELGLNNDVNLLPPVPHDQVPGYMARAHIFVLPSIEEGFGMVLVEAMAMGTVVIGSNSGGIPDIIKDGETGIIVPVKDPLALTTALKGILVNEVESKRFISSSRLFIKQRFSPEVISVKLKSLHD
ncbi:MAG: glycosyltransferase [candidate division Zixibacteria bacterium]|nr:glycosyltransferase [candidate division Zixibacteria bacterium]